MCSGDEYQGKVEENRAKCPEKELFVIYLNSSGARMEGERSKLRRRGNGWGNSWALVTTVG